MMPIEITEEIFRAGLQSYIDKFQLSHRDVAHIVGTSVPTVTRWVTGQSAPHHYMRGAILRMFEDECLE